MGALHNRVSSVNRIDGSDNRAERPLRTVGAVYHTAITERLAQATAISRRNDTSLPHTARPLSGWGIRPVWQQTLGALATHATATLACALALGCASALATQSLLGQPAAGWWVLALLAQTSAQVFLAWQAWPAGSKAYPALVTAWVRLLPYGLAHGLLVACAAAAIWMPFHPALPDAFYGNGITGKYLARLWLEAALDNRTTLAFDPGSPFQNLPQSMHGESLPAFSSSTSPEWMMVVCGLGLIVLVEAAFRFRAVAAVKGTLAGESYLRSMFRAARLGWRHLGQITVHIGLLRCAVLAAKLLLSFLAATARHLVLPFVNSLAGSMWPYQAGLLAIFVSGCLIEGLLAIFCMVYDVQLHRRLQSTMETHR